MFCEKCGSKVNEGVAFCSNCGTQLSASEDRPQISANTYETNLTAKPKKEVQPKFIVAGLIIAAILVGILLSTGGGTSGGGNHEASKTAVQCAPCSGTGKTTCTSCGGPGYKYKSGTANKANDFKEERVTCNSCNGSGKISCSYCSGTGWR